MHDYLKTLTVTQIKQLPVIYQATVVADQLDIMGHMNVRHYLGIFDDATFHFFSTFGMDAAYFEGGQHGSFALQQFIYYAAEVRLGQQVTVHSRLVGRTAKRIHFMHFMVNESTAALAATVEILGAHADLRVRRTSPYPTAIAAQIDRLIAQHSQLDWPAPLCGAISA